MRASDALRSLMSESVPVVYKTLLFRAKSGQAYSAVRALTFVTSVIAVRLWSYSGTHLSCFSSHTVPGPHRAVGQKSEGASFLPSQAASVANAIARIAFLVVMGSPQLPVAIAADVRHSKDPRSRRYRIFKGPCSSKGRIRLNLQGCQVNVVNEGRVPAPIHSPKVGLRKINLFPLFCPRNTLPLGSDPLCPNGYRSPPVAHPAAQGVGLGFVPADHRPETTRMIVHQGMAKLVYEHVAHQFSW